MSNANKLELSQVHFEAPASLIDALKALAARNERTLAAELRTLIRERLSAAGDIAQ